MKTCPHTQKHTHTHTSNLLSKHWNSLSLSWKPSARAPPVGRSDHIKYENDKSNTLLQRLYQHKTSPLMSQYKMSFVLFFPTMMYVSYCIHLLFLSISYVFLQNNKQRKNKAHTQNLFHLKCGWTPSSILYVKPYVWCEWLYLLSPRFSEIDVLFFCRLTCFGHALCTLHAWVQHLFCRYKENAVGSLLAVNNFQLLHKKVHTTISVLLSHLYK